MIATLLYVPYICIMQVLVYPIGIPLMYFVVLWRNRVLLNPTSTQLMPDHLSLALRDKLEEQLAGLSFLYKQYHSRVWWFELAETARRLVSNIITTYNSHVAKITDAGRAKHALVHTAYN
jgi:hypothetical protein